MGFMSKKLERDILKQGNLAYYTSLRLFPKTIRDDAAKLYSFVRIVGDTAKPGDQNVEAFKYIVRRWQKIKNSNDLARFKPIDDSVNERVLANITYVVHRYDCDPKLVDDFLKSVARDFRAKTFPNFKELDNYLSGSAESIGVILAKIMKLPNAALHYAKVQAKAFKLIDHLTKLNEDLMAGRCYFPVDELKKFSVGKPDENSALKRPTEFKKFIDFQIDRYRQWQKEAEKGAEFVPRRMRAGLKASIDAHKWIAKKLQKDPYIIFERRLRPGRIKIIRHAATKLVIK